MNDGTKMVLVRAHEQARQLVAEARQWQTRVAAEMDEAVENLSSANAYLADIEATLTENGINWEDK